MGWITFLLEGLRWVRRHWLDFQILVRPALRRRLIETRVQLAEEGLKQEQLRTLSAVVELSKSLRNCDPDDLISIWMAVNPAASLVASLASALKQERAHVDRGD